jgi:hypothetical protein
VSKASFFAAPGDNLLIRFAITTCAVGNLSGISGSADVDPRAPRSGVRDPCKLFVRHECFLTNLIHDLDR